MTDKLWPPAGEVELGYYELSTHLLALELIARDFPVTWHTKGFFTTEMGGEKVGFWCTRSNANSAIGVKVSMRKDMTRDLLRSGGLSVAEGLMFRDVEKAISYGKKLGYPLVVKPASGMKGRGVTVGITNDDELRRAWRLAAGRRDTRRVIVEEMFEGEEARFLVAGDHCVAVAKKVPPSVTGDGSSTVQELIDAKNRDRLRNPHLKRRPIEVDPHRRDMIRTAGFTLDDVLPEGFRLLIDHKAAFSAGGDSHDITDEVHPSLKKAAVDAAAAIPGLKVVGVDLLTKDFQSRAHRKNYIVVEVNSMPALGAHHFPWVGKPRNAAGSIIDYHEEVWGSRSRSRGFRRP